MASAADQIREFLTPLLPGWRMQFGRWLDGDKRHRYAVLKPAGGLPAELVRRPEFTLALVGAKDEPVAIAQAAADAVVDATRTSSGALIFLEAGEPAYHPTNDGRPVFELALSAITD